jgi:hypothetical protein
MYKVIYRCNINMDLPQQFLNQNKKERGMDLL